MSLCVGNNTKKYSVVDNGNTVGCIGGGQKNAPKPNSN